MSDLITTTLRADLLHVLDDPAYRPPPLPDVALELMTLSGRESPEVGQVVALLERDEMLAATVLRLVGSPIYAGRTPIRSLKEAVLRLGVRGVRDAVFESALGRGVFSIPEYTDTMSAIARHSTVTAYITRIVCKRARLDADIAFICGLLHDVGFAGLLLAVTHVEAEATPPLLQIWSDVDGLHEQASALLAARWGLPRDVTAVVGHHHPREGVELSPLAAAVCIADQLTERFGAVVLGPLLDGQPLVGDAVPPGGVERARALLGIDEHAMQLIADEAERVVPDIVWI